MMCHALIAQHTENHPYVLGLRKYRLRIKGFQGDKIPVPSTVVKALLGFLTRAVQLHDFSCRHGLLRGAADNPDYRIIP